MRSWNLLSMDSCAHGATRHLLTLSAMGMAAMALVACAETDGGDNSTLDRSDREAAALIGQGDGTLRWFKEDPWWNPLGGATFEICRTHDGAGAPVEPPTCYTIEDNGAHDSDGVDGSFQVEGLLYGTWTITETVAPAGYVVDLHDTQTLELSAANPTAQPAMAFMNDLAGSLRWSKEDEHWDFLAGATFEACRTHAWNYDTSSMDLLPTPECIEITDNGPNDSDPADGIFVLEGVRLGTWAIHETVAPPGYTAIPDVHIVELTVDDPHDPEAEAFMNAPAGSLYWFKEDEHWNALGGATFEVCRTQDFGWDAAMNVVYTPLPAPGDCFTLTDNDATDEDPRDGVFLVSGLPLGHYTITETAAPAGYVLDPDAQTVILSLGNVDGQPAHPFLNLPFGGLTWDKVDDVAAPLAGATFEVCRVASFDFDEAMVPFFTDLPAPYDCITVTDNDANDADPADGSFALADLELGRYTITETAAPVGYDLDPTPQEVELTGDTPQGAAAFAFVNLPVPPPGNPGACTHGFFKTHSGQWDDPTDELVINAGFDINTDVHTFFGLDPNNTGLPADLTMLEALQLGGGGAVNVLRQGITALLNVASGFDYPYTPIVTLYDDIVNALTTGDFSLGETLDRANNAEECGLPGNVGKTPKELKKPETPPTPPGPKASNGPSMNSNRR